MTAQHRRFEDDLTVVLPRSVILDAARTDDVTEEIRPGSWVPPLGPIASAATTEPEDTVAIVTGTGTPETVTEAPEEEPVPVTYSGLDDQQRYNAEMEMLYRALAVAFATHRKGRHVGPITPDNQAWTMRVMFNRDLGGVLAAMIVTVTRRDVIVEEAVCAIAVRDCKVVKVETVYGNLVVYWLHNSQANR